MKIRLISVALACVLALQSAALAARPSAQATAADQQQSVSNATRLLTPSTIPDFKNLRATHPRLIFTPELEASLHQRASTDPLLAQLIDKTRQRSDELDQLPPVKFETIPSSIFGVQMLAVSRQIEEHVIVHAFMYRYSGERKYADRLWREMETALAYPTWNPAHFLDAAEMGLAVAFAYDWAYDAWTPEQRARLREAMKTRVLKRGLEIFETRTGLSSFFVTATSNWNSVSNAGILATALAMAEDEPEIAQRALRFVIPSLDYPRGHFASGGAMDEGQSYWSYSLDFFLLTSQLLSSAFGNDGGLADDKAFAHAAPFRLYVRAPNGRNYTYADSWDVSNSHLGYTILAQRYGPQQVIEDMREEFKRYLAATEATPSFRLYPLAYLFLPPPVKNAASVALPLDVFYRSTIALALMRGAWNDPKAAFAGFKAGHVNHNHNHLDAGSFIFDAAGVRWSTDLGPESYEVPEYFRKETNPDAPINDQTRHLPNRWQYYRTNNYGHSTLTLGHNLQRYDAVAPFIATGSTPRFAFSVADLSSVYPGRVQHWQRGVALVDRRWLVVRDELRGLQKGVAADWAMMTEAEVNVAPDGRSATLTRDGQTLRFMLAKAPNSARINAAPALPSTKAESQNEGITRISVAWSAQTDNETIEVHLVPASARGVHPVAGLLKQWSRKR